MTDVVLEATGVLYYSYNDEAAFFEWLDKVGCVASYRGELRTLHITLEFDTVDEEDLRDLVALYRRYDIDLRELRVLNADTVGPWFSDPARSWHDEVFGAGSL
ncbi:hypothetical protein [Nocardia sp. NPDC057227]|uniref:hypothetical protein n=1 Tax=Nocardia sp. NPDC057227 TaxID=3346056 RepID=UPI003626A6D6